MKILPILGENLPTRANAGLNFYIGAFTSLGPAQQSLLLACFGEIEFAVLAIVISVLFTSFVSPFISEIFISQSIRKLNAGYLWRFIFSAIMCAVIVSSIIDQTNSKVVYLVLYVLLFTAVSITHKVYFNIGWLFIMGEVTPKSDANIYVANVRRINTLTSMVLNLGLILIISNATKTASLFYIGIISVCYSLWSFLALRSALYYDKSFRNNLSKSLPSTGTTHSLNKVIEVIKDRKNWKWLIPSVLPTILAPPLIIVYAVKITNIGWDTVFLALLSVHVISTLMLPSVIKRIEHISTSNLINSTLVITALNIALLYIARHFYGETYTQLSLIGISVLLGNFAAQSLSIIVHNKVISYSKHSDNASINYGVYNLILDVIPDSWLVIASIVIPLSQVNAFFTFYELTYACSLIVCILGIYYSKGLFKYA
jgi:hypothetical protein